MTTEYTAPIADMRFVLNDVLKTCQRDDLYNDLDYSEDLLNSVLEEMAKFSQRIIHPLNHSADQEACTLDNGSVKTPTGFKDAYKQYSEDGWIGMTASPDDGGLGLPHSLHAAVGEMVSSANPSFSMYTGLNKAAIEALKATASSELLEQYIPKLVTGEWAATMSLTEANAGTDLGLLRTKAIKSQDSSYRITGSKIFISGGDHDLTENIIHLVLAKVPSAPAGSRGISLFVVPKYILNKDGTLGKQNNAQCTGIEKKMGLKGSATCSMYFEDAKGYIVGEENKGLLAMFAMMNIMRLSVGSQGVSMAQIAYENACTYSKERLQGRAANSPLDGNQADPLIKIPDIRRMLMSSKSFTEGARALTYWTGMQIDISESSKNKQQRDYANKLLSLVTPVVKGCLTEMAEPVVSMCLQCFGGHGYISETGVEQFYRDARISKIYEGATGVQAIDLLGRKVLHNNGSLLFSYIADIKSAINLCKAQESLSLHVDAMSNSVKELEVITGWLIENSPNDVNLAGSASHHYLMMTGLISIGYMWLLMSLTAQEQLDTNPECDKQFMNNKIITGNFFMSQYLADTSALSKKIVDCSSHTMILEEIGF